jgi:hypothetical protein
MAIALRGLEDIHEERVPLLPTVALSLLFFFTTVAPPASYTLLDTPSMAAGTLFVCLLFLCLGIAIGRPAALRSLRQGLKFVLIPFSIVALHGIASYAFNDEFDFGRFWQSQAVLGAMLLAAMALAMLSFWLTPRQLDLAIRIVFYSLLATATASVLGYLPFETEFSRPVVIFAEPSHFAMTFFPFLLYMMVASGRTAGLAIYAVSLILAFALYSLTLVVGIMLIAAIAMSPRRLVAISLLVGAVMLVFEPEFAQVDIDYYASRIDFSLPKQNLSTLVFMQGWQGAWRGFEDTFGLGVGFQQFGIAGRYGDVLDDVAVLAGGTPLNRFDGGSVAAKFIGEFGVLGILAVGVYLVYFFSRARWLRRAQARVEKDFHGVFFSSCFLMYAMDIFVRGSGYFSSSGFLFVASIAGLLMRGSVTAANKPADNRLPRFANRIASATAS